MMNKNLIFGGGFKGSISLKKLFEAFGLPVEPPFEVEVTQFNIEVSTATKDYSLIVAADVEASIPGLEKFALYNITGSYASLSKEFEFTGTFYLEADNVDTFVTIYLEVRHAEATSWFFSGNQISGQINIVKLFTQFLPEDWKPDPKFDVLIDGLGLQIETKTNSWKFQGKTARPILIPGIEIEVDLALQMGFNGGTSSFGGRETIRSKENIPILAEFGSFISMEEVLVSPQSGLFGTAQADIVWEDINLTVFYDFKPGFKEFGIKLGIFEGRINPDTHIVTIRFTRSTSIGSIIETMIGWATGSKYGLEAPWNLLNSIPLNNLELEFNFTTKEVGLNVNIGPINIGLFGVNIATINKITVDYSKAKGVLVTLDGSFQWLGDGSKLPSWDATKPETTPGPPAMGNKYVDIRMLALGQHIEVQGLSSAPNVKKAIELIEKLPDPEPGKTPPVTLEPNNGWLVGLDMGLLRIDPPKQQAPSSEITLVGLPPAKPGEYVFDMKLVFSDPNLYGLAIGLNGTAAKIFQGLKFEIMYRKVTESVGVYQAEIVLPDRMRYIRLGQLNVTLPVFGIEIYTNSDFKVDLGFPWNADFSRSFTFQTIIWAIVPIPITGSIGIYFGKLSSDTSTQLPAFDKSKGMFNPVVVFGFGIQFGLGYDFNIGILSAGFRLTAVAIIEGVIAKWNPYLPEASSGSNDRLEESYYFSLRGTVGFVGKLYGSVDFAIIKASVNIDIKILAQLYFAPYEPIELSIAASLTATAGIKINLGIFSINIHFSFSIGIQQELTLPAIGGKAPWSGDTVHTSLERRYARQRMVRLARRIEQLPFATLIPQWDNLEAAATPAELNAFLTLGLTMAQDENQEMPTLEGQKACYISMLMLDSVRAPQEDRNSCRIKAADPAQDSAFEIMSKQIFRWVVAAIGTEKVSSEQVDQSPVSYTALDSLLDYLSDPKNPVPIPSAAIEQFMTNQYIMKVQTPKEGDDAHTTCFPMVPSLGFNIPSYGTDPELIYTYATYNSISKEYLNELRKYFDELAVKAQNQDYHLFDDSLLEQMEALSIASFVFSDYYALLARQMVQMALNSLKNYTYSIQAGDTPAGIVQWINEHGRLTGDETFTIEQLFNDNSSHALNSVKTLRLEGVIYTVQTAESFRKIITKESFGAVTPKVLAEFNADTKNLIQGGVSITYSGDKKYTTLPGTTLKGIADAVEMPLSDLLDNSNIMDLETLLIPAASIDVPAFNYETVEEDTLTSISVKFGTTVKLMAEAQGNADIIDLFKSTETPDLNIVQLAQFEVGELLKEIQRTQGLQHLAGLTSRYYMAGLRLITKGITPNYKGMWVTGETGAYALPNKAGLYALTGQQFPIPTLINGTPFEVQFSSTEPWLELIPRSEESGPIGTTTLSIQIADGSTEATQIQKLQEFANYNYLNTDLTKLGYQPLFDTQPASYTFHSAVRWASPSTVTMPYPDSAKGLQDLRLWRLPDSLAKLSDLRKHKINPCIKIKLGQYDQATQTLKSEDLTDYGFGSRVEFTIKKVASISESPATKTTYEVLGADGQNVALLESLLQQIGANNSAIKSLHIAYAQEKNENGNVSIQTDDPVKLTIGISQVNLSTDTRPPDGSNAAFDLQDLEGIQLTEPTEFIRLLWQAGITRAGGYYLYYFNEESGGGFPDRIFNNEGEAKVSIIVLFSDNDHLLASYMNTVITSKSVNFADYTLFAESVPQTYPFPGDSETFANLAEQYYANIEDLADAVKDAQLPDKATLSISNGIYQVGLKAPAGNLAQIATHFGTTVEAIKSANPQITEWPDPLPLYTAFFLPELTITIGTSPGGDKLSSIAGFYGQSLGYIAGLNRHVRGLLINAGGLTFKSGPVEIKPKTPQGTMAVDAACAVPPEIPKDPNTTDYAQIFLKNTFSLLAYRVQKNQFFSGSSEGLPMSPGTFKQKPLPNGKFGLPPQLTEEDEWEYKIALPYAKFTEASEQAVPHPDDSPYRGLGRLFQVNFNCQDIYGNKLLSTLEYPVESVPLNEPTKLTEYTDQLVSLSQWPSISASWEVRKEGEPEQPLLQVLLNFDPTVFDGLWSASIQSENRIMAQFTNELDVTSANSLENYELSDGVTIQTVALQEDKKSVKITVNILPVAGNITLQVKNLKSRETEAIYDGTATFTQQGFVTSSLKNQVMASLATYRLLWYQLTDPLGVNLGIQTSLLNDSQLNLSAEQFDQLISTWLSAIYEFIEKRSKGETTTHPTETLHKIKFSLSGLALNTADIFKVETSFIMARKRHDLISNFAYGNDLLSSQTLIAPTTTEVDETHSLTDFAKHFEDALSTEEAQLTLATGVDRLQPATSIDGTLWGIRLKKTGTQGIGFEVDSSEPFLFAPKPISNSLISKSGVEICTFTPKTGLDCTETVRRDFVDIDLDLWCKQLFEAIDHVLSPIFVPAIQLIDHVMNKTYLKGLQKQKEDFADIVKTLMIPIFEGEFADPAIIQGRFKQNLLVLLSNAYNVQAGIQYKAIVQASSTSVPPKLYGNVSQRSAIQQGGIAMTSPKLPLEKSDDAPLSFLLSSPGIVRGKDKEVLPYLTLELEYSGSNIEHQIGDVPGIVGYKASSWLKFMNSDSVQLLKAELPIAKVPLPLRAFPISPRMTLQDGRLSDDQSVEKLLLWDYKLVYSQAFHYPQDKLHFIVQSNLKKVDARYKDDRLDGETPDLVRAFNEIAQFIMLYPDLEKGLLEVAKIEAATPKDSPLYAEGEVVLHGLNLLLKGIIDRAKNVNRFDDAEVEFAGEPYSFYLQEGSDTIDGVPDVLLISISNDGIVPDGFGKLSVHIDGYETMEYDGCEKDYCFYFKKRTSSDSDQESDLLQASKGQTIPERTISLSGLNVLAKQDISASVSIKRNPELVPGKQTNTAFVYTTGAVQFPNYYYPSFIHTNPVDIAKLHEGQLGKTLKEHLENLFEALLKENLQKELSFSMDSTYSYDVNALHNKMALPIIMQPIKTFVLSDPKKAPAEMISAWANYINIWLDNNKPSKTNGQLNFNLTIFSNLTQEPKPLIQLSNLYLKLADVFDVNDQ